MAEFDVTIGLPDLDADKTDQRIDALYEAGCDDATIACGRAGFFVAMFNREGPKDKAVASALADIAKALPGAEVTKIEFVA